MSHRGVLAILLLMGCLFCLPASDLGAQARYPRGGYVRAEELVTISPEMRFPDVLNSILKPMAKRFEGKPIIDRSGFGNPIGVGITNVHWKKALEVILSHNGLQLQTYDDYYEIVTAEVAVVEEKPVKEEVSVDTREIRISAVFFEADRSALQELGMDWSFTKSPEQVTVQDGQVEIGREGTVEATFAGGSLVSEEIAVISGAKKISSAVDIAGLLRTVQSKNKGEIIANPQITVVDGKEGRIKIGESVSILTRDEAGNTVSELVDAGIILTIKPRIITEDGIDFIYVELTAERSTATPAAGGVSKTETSAQTFALLQDGDQTILGGLYTDTETKTRTGIPFLKDLPWWVFGIKFLAGYEGTSTGKKELIVVLQASIIPSIRERMEMRKASLLESRELRRQKFEQMKKDLKD